MPLEAKLWHWCRIMYRLIVMEEDSNLLLSVTFLVGLDFVESGAARHLQDLF